MDKKVALKYVQRRKRRKRAAIISLISATGILIFTIIAFLLLRVDRFTISTTDNPELCLTIDESKERLTTTLSAPPLLRANDTQYSDIPENIGEGLGSKNDDHYFAYSFYLGGVGTSTLINYSLSLTLDRVSNELEDAIKIMIIRNGYRQIYAKANEDGSPKLIYKGDKNDGVPSEILGSTIPFEDNKHIIWKIYNIKPGDYDKYTIVMWIDGWESVNSMKGGAFEANLKFSTESTIEKGD